MDNNPADDVKIPDWVAKIESSLAAEYETGIGASLLVGNKFRRAMRDAARLCREYRELLVALQDLRADAAETWALIQWSTSITYHKTLGVFPTERAALAHLQEVLDLDHGHLAYDVEHWDGPTLIKSTRYDYDGTLMSDRYGR